MKIYTNDILPQHLPDGEANPYWLEIRAGKFTASDFHQYMSIVKKGELSDTAESNLYKKALESVGYDFGESTKSAAMEQGTELEPIARQEYIEKTFNDVQEVGFVDWEKLRAGCSPDGVIYDGDNIAKIIEIKCPEIKNYLRMASGKIPPLYITQMQFNMLITGAKSCDFVVYHPDMRLVVQEINADKDYQDQIVIALEKLNARYDEILEEIKRYKK
jgi:putative phage-type endonuclease